MLLAAVVFVGTDVDDLVVLTVLFLSARATGRPRPGQIWLGQYAGIGALVAISAVAALGLVVVPDRWVGLIGLVPLGMGLWGLASAIRSRGSGGGSEADGLEAGGLKPDGPKAPRLVTSALSVAALTIANGADNIAVYTPVFRTLGLATSLVTVAVFAVLVAGWCALASWLGSHRRIVAVVDRWGHWLVPGLFVLIGLAILVESAFAP